MAWAKRSLCGLIAVLGMGSLAGCAAPPDATPTPADLPSRSLPTTVNTPVIGTSSIAESAVDEGFLAVVLADRAVNVAAQVAGRVESIPVRLGDPVERHQPLAVIRAESPKQAVAEAQAALDEARSQLRRAELELTEANEGYRRQQQLADLSSKEALRQRELDRQVAESEVEASRARVSQLESRLAQGQWRVAEHTIRAPFAGEVAARYAEPGTWITAGMPIVRVVSVEALRVRFAVPADRSNEIEVGLAVSFNARNWKKSAIGGVKHIAPEIEPASQMVFVEALLEEAPPEIRPGEVGRVQLVDMTPRRGAE